MSDGRKRIVSPFTGCKNKELEIRLKKNINRSQLNLTLS